jgi:uncharacterized membrane-anchored protein
MKRSSASTAAFLILGVILFFLGLLMLLHQVSVVNFFSPIFPDVQSIELAGVVLQSLGGIFVVYFAVKFVSSGLTARAKESQAMVFSVMQSMERLEKGMAVVSEKLSIEKSGVVAQASVPASSTCRFCGAKIDVGSSFCPNCGRSQK